jgi:lambda family phage portal protein
MKEQRLAIAAASGVLYETLSGDYAGVNDRTWRAAVSEFRRRCEMWQHHLLVFQFCRPILARWIDFALLAGRFKLPADVTAQMIARARWIPVPWPYINPVQDIEAKKAAMRAGMASRSQTVSEQGYDVAELDREIADDNDRADKLGLIFDSDPRRTANSGAEQALAPGGDAGDEETAPPEGAAAR